MGNIPWFNSVFGVAIAVSNISVSPNTISELVYIHWLQTVSDNQTVGAEINEEIMSEEKQRLVPHDSCGFEPGEVDKFQITRKFIQSRLREPNIKDRLYAVW